MCVCVHICIIAHDIQGDVLKNEGTSACDEAHASGTVSTGDKGHKTHASGAVSTYEDAHTCGAMGTCDNAHMRVTVCVHGSTRTVQPLTWPSGT